MTVTAATAATILYTQSSLAVWFSLGAVASTLMGGCCLWPCRHLPVRLTHADNTHPTAKVAKKLIREPRPDTPPPESTKTAPVKTKQTYGMPSTHSTALSYYFFYLFPILPLVSASKWGERALLTAVCGTTIWSRVELGYHTVPQVLGGAVVGAIGAFTWSSLWKNVPSIETNIQTAIDVTRQLVWPK